MKHKIKTATACYTGGSIYIYYGQLESGLYFAISDLFDSIAICDSETGSEEADYPEFYDAHLVEHLTGDDYKTFWNAMLTHIITGCAAHDKWMNFSRDDLERRFED